MQILTSLFVGKPLNIFLVAALFLAGFLALRFLAPGMPRTSRPLLIAAIAWGIYAAWEWLVKVRTPEANIRVDLLVLWPVLAIVSLWALFRSLLRPPGPHP